MTSENLHAKAIAFKCGILNHDEDLNNEAVVEGEIFKIYLPGERIKVYVMARSTPFDKLLMVQSSKDKGHIFVKLG